jgi:hypothetical protein
MSEFSFFSVEGDMNMKFNLFIIALLFALIATGCDIKKDFTFTVEKEFVQTNSPNKSFSMTGDISATQISSDFDNYKDDIDNIEIVSSKYLVSYFSGSTTQTISTHIKIGDTGGQQSVDLASVTNINLYSVASIDQSLDLSSAGNNKLTELLKNSPYSLRLYFDGSTNEVPLTATIKLKFEIKVTYKKGFPYL